MIEIDRDRTAPFNLLSFECLVIGRDEAWASWREAAAASDDEGVVRYNRLYDLLFEAVQLVEPDFEDELLVPLAELVECTPADVGLV